MRSPLALALALTASLGASTLARDADAQAISTTRRFGLGVIISTWDAGISGSYYVRPDLSLNLGVMLFDPYRDRGFAARFDALFWFDPVLHGSVAALRPFLGVGGRVNQGNGHIDPYKGFGLGAVFNAGVGLHFVSVPIELAVAVDPILWILQDARVEFDVRLAGSFYARWYF